MAEKSYQVTVQDSKGNVLFVGMASGGISKSSAAVNYNASGKIDLGDGIRAQVGVNLTCINTSPSKSKFDKVMRDKLILDLGLKDETAPAALKKTIKA